jgi:hypothetical protein
VSRGTRLFTGAIPGFHEAHVVEFADDAIRRRTRDMPTLYEVWATLRILDASLHWATRNGWRVTRQRLYERPSARLFSFSIPKGSNVPMVELVREGSRLLIYAQRTYSPNAPPGQPRAVASRQVPDVCMELRDQNDRPTDVLVLDPKYKLTSEWIADSPSAAAEPDAGLELEEVGQPPEVAAVRVRMLRPKKVDIDKMHTYRDAIRGASGEPVVRAAYIIFPGETIEFPTQRPLVGALGARPGDPQLDAAFDAKLARLLEMLVSQGT